MDPEWDGVQYVKDITGGQWSKEEQLLHLNVSERKAETAAQLIACTR